tara:strand:- start:62 stop:1054 length:993 start_codon:yes stop_codon:yes gene_type:complete
MLSCGSNAALDQLTGKVDEIKGKLAEGMGALGDLEAKANEAIGQLTSLIPEIPSFDSLQGDLAAALAAAQGDAAAAFATFKEKWGEVLPESEIQGYIDTITAIASDPTALLTFDACQAFPNKELDTATGQVATKAKVAEIPNEAPPKITPYEPVITKTYETRITDEMTAATQARKDNLQKQADYFGAVKAAHRTKRDAILDDPGFQSAKKKSKAAGKKPTVLLDEGALTDAEAKGVEKAKAFNEELEVIKARDYLMGRQLLAYGFLLDGSMPAEIYNKEAETPGTYLQGGKDNSIPQADLDKFAELSANLDAVATGLKQWKEYRDERTKD